MNNIIIKVLTCYLIKYNIQFRLHSRAVVIHLFEEILTILRRGY